MAGWQDAPIVGEAPAKAPAWQSAPVVSQAGPDRFAAARAAKAGTLVASPESVARHEEMTGRAGAAMDAEAEKGFLRRGMENFAQIGRPVDQFVTGYDESPAAQAGRNVGTLLNIAGESATLGLVGDEAAAAADALIGRGGGYDERLAHYRGEEARMREEHPYLSLGADLAGALVPGAGMAKVVGASASLPGAIMRGAGAGALGGGVHGFMEGEGDGRLSSGAGGAMIGAGVGGAIPVIARGVGAAVRGVKDWTAGRRAVAQIADDLGVSRPVATHLTDAIGADDLAAMRSSIQKGGPGAMLADAGPSVQGALDGAMQRPGPAARIGMQRIEGRAGEALQTVNRALDKALGAPAGRETAKSAVRSSTAAARAATYDAAYARPIPYGLDTGGGRQIGNMGQALKEHAAARKLEGLLPRVPGRVVQDANRLMQLDGHTSAQIMAQVADDGSVRFTRLPDVRQWDYIKRALDQAASTGEGQGALGGQTAMGRAYEGLARSVRDTLREAVPAYGDALETAADAISQTRGIETGYALLRPGTTREQVVRAVKGATGPELAAVKSGLRSYIDDVLANVRAVVSDPNVDAREARKALSEMTSRASRAKISAVLRGDAKPLFDALEEASRALGLRSAVAQNSKTFARQAFAERSRELSRPGVLRNLATARPVESIRGMAERATGSTPEAVARRADRVNAELVDYLTRPGAANALNAISAIERGVAAHPVNALAGMGTTNALNALGFAGLPDGVNALRARVGW